MIGGHPAPAQAHLQSGFQFLQQGRMEEAWGAFHAALRLEPDNALGHHMVGLIAMQAGQLEMGVQSLRRSIALHPNDPAAYGNLANGLRELGRHAEALNTYDKALAMAPDFVDAINNRAILLGRIGRHADALAGYERALALAPNAPFLHNNRADALAKLGRPQEALASYDRAVTLDPGNAEAHFNRGNLLAGLGRTDDALAAFDRAVSLRPDYVEGLTNRANLLLDAGRHAEALADYDRAIALQADSAKAYANRADALRKLNRFEEALESADRALALDPNDAGGLNNRGNVLLSLNRGEEAVEVYERAVSADPEAATGWNNRGVALMTVCRFDEAMASFQRAEALKPGYAEARFNIATIKLVQGDYAGGWKDYEARKTIPGVPVVPPVDFTQPEWLGEGPIEGRTILLVAEQGLGDALQFCRYAPVLAERGAKVVLQADPPLLSLLSRLKGVDRVIGRSQAPPEFDAYSFLMSLPLALGTTLETVPGQPYLRADPAKAAAWAERLGPRGRPRVGLVWSGGMRQDQPELWNVNRRRNLPIGLLAPLAGAEVDFFSLQKGEPAEGELAARVAVGWNGPAMVDHTAALKDFDDTAALVENLDLVIAVDTSTAHLAGALGKPVWILNRFDTCWRWGLERSDSPWYPSARLFRQRSFGEWAPVMEEVAAALKAFSA